MSESIEMTRREAFKCIDLMLSDADLEGLDYGYGRRLLKGGELGLCFREIFFMAKAHLPFLHKWEVEIQSLNTYFSADPYMVKHCGFPLK
jgi:hypothetical protein